MFKEKLTTEQKSQLAHTLHEKYRNTTNKNCTDRITLRLVGADIIKVYPQKDTNGLDSFDFYTIIFSDYAARIFYPTKDLKKFNKINCDAELQDFMGQTFEKKYTSKLAKQIKKGTFDAPIQKIEQAEKDYLI